MPGTFELLDRLESAVFGSILDDLSRVLDADLGNLRKFGLTRYVDVDQRLSDMVPSLDRREFPL